MNTYIALLRGINVGGHKKVPMAELRELLSNAGFKKVQTYIQSGNVILESSEDSAQNIEDIIQKAITTHFGFEVSVIVKKPKQLQRIFDNCSFPETKKENSYFTLLHTIPDTTLVESILKETYPNEEFVITNECVYGYCSIGYGSAKCNTNFFERKLKVTATARNYKTMVKLLSLSQ